LKLKWDRAAPGEIAPRLSDPRPAVQDRGIATLAQQGHAAVDALRQLLRASQPVVARRNAVGTLARIDTPAARAGIRDATRDSEATERQAAVNALGWARDQASAARMNELLGDPQIAIRREAATALGRIGGERAVGALLGALRTAGDAFLQHSLIFALIQTERPELIIAGLADESARVRRGALLALAQMEKVVLTREQIAPLLRADDVELQRAAFSVASRAPVLRGELMAALRARLNEPPAPARAELIRETLSGLASDADFQAFVVELLERKESHPQVKMLLIEAMRESGLRQFPASWLAAIARELRTGEPDVRMAVIALTRERSVKAIDNVLQEIAADGAQPESLRAACLEALAARLSPVPPALFEFADQRLDRSDTPAAKLAAARTMAALALSDGQLKQLAARLPATEPLILPALLRAFSRSTNDAVGTALVAALDRTPATQSVTSDELMRLLRKYPATTQAAAKPLLARLGADLEKQKSHLEELSAHLAGGDIGRGQQIFFGKAACAACHRVSGQGGLIGPNLTGIAEVRTGRDLLESVVYPSASIVQGYQPFNVQTRDGQSYSGLLVRQAPDAVWLRGADQLEVKVDAQQIVSMTESTVSLMPQGLDATLGRDEFRDLFAYLQSLKRLSSSAPERPATQ
jgi:putative heme-binding domain-containing protein